MSEVSGKRRSSFFPKPVEENHEKQLELFKNMNWVNDEKENIISNSIMFGGLGKQALQEYTQKLISRKHEYPKLVSSKQEEQIHLKDKLRKSKVEINWETACDGLTDFEREFTLNRPNYKCLVEKIHLLTLHTALVKRSNHELHKILNAYNRRANEEINKLQELFIDKIVEDSGVGTSYYSNDTNLSTMDLSEDESLKSN
ncbi:PREDICTED: uncharacterized protein LOC107165850 [Diuraphis noxia]|uniref:uncharacterized protein LOC107165850 n=1 Tax=Diuraphis noxia TaxID=143948 RepID=UPI0007637C1F|nr:PREDICTED: uncharacterized protein LOC107165850 [Diuraphis noxia]